MSVRLIETGGILNTRVIAEIAANKLRKGDSI